ncbi:MAG: alpha/beta hydrolase [Cyclobacteriaceae bacterium]
MNHHVNMSFRASYATMNEIHPGTKHIWIACHGYGQLANHFIKRFDVFDPERHFILAPEGLARFYLNGHKKVGASWMTKHDRETDLENQQSYFDALFRQVFGQTDLKEYQLHLLGFSQGVSMISRLAAYKRLNFDHLILWAGGFPPELCNEDFTFLKKSAKLKIVLGSSDQFFQMPAFQTDIDKAASATGLEAELMHFDGGHELDREVLSGIVD